MDWTGWVTTKDVGFERFERYVVDDNGNFYEFRMYNWLLLVDRKFVVHREDLKGVT